MGTKKHTDRYIKGIQTSLGHIKKYYIPVE